jgi:hypothetical protein
MPSETQTNHRLVGTFFDDVINEVTHVVRDVG